MGGGGKTSTQTQSQVNVPSQLSGLMDYVLPDVESAYTANPLSYFASTSMPSSVAPLTADQKGLIGSIVGRGGGSYADQFNPATQAATSQYMSTMQQPLTPEQQQATNYFRQAAGMTAPETAAGAAMGRYMDNGGLGSKDYLSGSGNYLSGSAPNVAWGGVNSGPLSSEQTAENEFTRQVNAEVGKSPATLQAEQALEDQYKRRTLPSLQNQMALAGLGRSGALGDAITNARSDIGANTVGLLQQEMRDRMAAGQGLTAIGGQQGSRNIAAGQIGANVAEAQANLQGQRDITGATLEQQRDITGAQLGQGRDIAGAQIGSQAARDLATLGGSVANRGLSTAGGLANVGAQAGQRQDAATGSLFGAGQYADTQQQQRDQTAFDAAEVIRQMNQSPLEEQQQDYLRRQGLATGTSGTVTGFAPQFSGTVGKTVSTGGGGSFLSGLMPKISLGK